VNILVTTWYTTSFIEKCSIDASCIQDPGNLLYMNKLLNILIWNNESYDKQATSGSRNSWICIIQGIKYKLQLLTHCEQKNLKISLLLPSKSIKLQCLEFLPCHKWANKLHDTEVWALAQFNNIIRTWNTK